MITDKSLVKVAPLFLVLFIDGMGLSLLFPIVNSMIMDPQSTFVAANTSISMRQFLYGFVIGIFMICWFFGATILGDLSDMVGRKKALMLCLLGACLGYLISGLSVMIPSLTVLVIGRVIAGFTSGSQPIAQAAIVDVSSEEKKARNIGLILFAVSMGFVLGPLLGGILSDPHFVNWFNFSTPLYFAALLSLVNAVLLQCMFKETFYKTGKIRVKFHRAVTVFISAFRHHRIRNLSLVMLILIFGWSSYFSFISMYVMDTYHFSTLKVSLFMADLGIGFAMGCGYFVDFFSKRYPLKRCVIVASLITAFFVLLVLVVHDEVAAWIFNVAVGAAMTVAYSIIIAMFSQQVSSNEQGWVMGVTGSIMALCFGITSFLTGVVVELGDIASMIMAIGGLFVSGVLLYFTKVPPPFSDDTSRAPQS